jgi:vacuolar-type H+-ATPase subunit E/Vma4
MMELYGSPEGLKREIESKYKKEISKVQDSAETRAREIISDAKKSAEEIIEQAKTDAQVAAREAKQRVLNEEKLKAKKEYEIHREKLIRKVFEKIDAEIPRISKSREYLAFLKRNAIKNGTISALGSRLEYKKIFPKMTLNKTINGVKVFSSEAVYDYTLESMLRTQEENVREIVVKKIFGEQ